MVNMLEEISGMDEFNKIDAFRTFWDVLGPKSAHNFS